MTDRQSDDPGFAAMPEATRTLNRRTLIKGAAAAGAAAWAAPVIIDSFASPAAATMSCSQIRDGGSGGGCQTIGADACTGFITEPDCSCSPLCTTAPTFTQSGTCWTIGLKPGCTIKSVYAFYGHDPSAAGTGCTGGINCSGLVQGCNAINSTMVPDCGGKLSHIDVSYCCSS